MSKSLAGGLVPLGNGQASGSSGGSKALSGGLIPLAGQSKSSAAAAAAAGGSTATFGRLGLDSDGSDWDEDDEETEGKAATGSAFIDDNKVRGSMSCLPSVCPQD